MHFFKVKLLQERENGHGRSSGLIPLPRPSRFQWHKMGRGLRISRRRVRSRFTRDSLFKPFRVAPPVRLPLSEGTLGAARGPVNAAGQMHLIPAFKASYLPGLSVKTGLFDVGGVIRRFLPLTYLSTALLLMPVRLARLANGHGPLDRLSVGFHAKKRHFPCQRRRILVFRILPAPAIRLHFAPAEQRWLCPTLGKEYMINTNTLNQPYKLNELLYACPR